MDSAVTVKGQTTIPKAVREHLGLKAGDRVRFFLHPDGYVAILPKRPASALRGLAAGPGRKASLEEMDAAIAEAAAESASASR